MSLGLPMARVYGSAATVRPAGRPQPAFGPFDVSDPGGLIHTTLPPEQVIPPSPTRDWWRGDFGGVTLAQTPPMVPGANTTPREMTMSFLLPFYERRWQDIILTEHCWRSYSHFHLARGSADIAGLNATQFVSLLQYVQSWGFYTSYWGIDTGDGHFKGWDDAKLYLQPTLDALAKAGAATCARTILIVGEELNRIVSPEGLLEIVGQLSPICRGLGVAMYLHFTSNYPSWQVPSSTPMQFWQQMHALGVTGLCWQGDPADTHGKIGTLGAHLWDARRYLGAASPDLRVCAFEPGVQTEQLYGRLTEADGRRIGYELICCPNGGTGYPPVAGAMSGLSNPDGSPV